MLHQILSTTRKDLKILLKDPGGLATLFLMPMMFIIVMSTALQGLFNTGTDTQPRRLPVVNLDRGEYTAQVIEALDTIDGIEVETAWDGVILTRERAEALVADGDRSVAVLFPADFSAQIEARAEDDDATAIVELIADPAVSTQFIAPIQGMVFGAAEHVAETEVAQVHIAKSLASVFAQLPPEMQPASGQIVIEMDGTNVVVLKQVAPAEMTIEVEPDTYQQNVPGYTVLGVFFIVGTMASSILAEKREGTFRRLLVAPLPKPILLAGKILPYYLVNLIQIAIMFGVAHLLFGMAFGDPAALAVISMALAAAATGLGIMIAALGKTDTQIGGLTSLLTLTMSALGGCLMPTFIMPGFLQTLSRFIPHAWAMQGFQDVLVRGYGLAEILPEASILLGFAAVFFLIGVWRFRFD
ncbi:MAG: ABC transporter permease [Anaerolineae bacterium]|nr:ABC transporter permease [Anaerolineae bacterium]